MSSAVETTSPQPVQIDTGDAKLNGDLTLPSGARGFVAFAHGSGSSRHSSRNLAVAAVLHEAKLGTLALDLLTDREARVDASTAEFRFDIPRLAGRVSAAVEWMRRANVIRDLPLGLFGASTGAAAALIAAAEQPRVAAVVSRGGRPDLAGDALPRVKVPTLLIVGGNDDVVIALNENALTRIGSAKKELQIVPGATHLFEEPGALADVARLARDWFVRFLAETDNSKPTSED